MKKAYSFMFSRLSKSSKLLLFMSFVESITYNLSVLFIPILQKQLLDRITDNNESSSFIAYIAVCSLCILCMVFGTIVNSYIQRAIQRKLQEEMLIGAVYDDSLITARGPGAYLTSIFGDTERIVQILGINIFDMIFQIVSAIVALVITWKWNHIFVYTVIPSYIILIGVQFICQKSFITAFTKGREKVYETNPKVLEFIENRNTVVEYTQLQEFLKPIYRLFNERDHYFIKSQVVSSVGDSATLSVKLIATCALFILATPLIQNNSLTMSEFVAMLSYLAMVYLPINTVNEYINQVESFKVVYDKIKRNLKEEIKTGLPDKKELGVENCDFSYENKPVLQNINLNVKTKIGLVGISGEGKSTLIKILLGKIKPAAGKCLFGNMNTSNINSGLLMYGLNYYPQSIELFNEDLRYNITLGKRGINSDEYTKKVVEIKSALKELFDKIRSEDIKNIHLRDSEAKLIKKIFMMSDNYKLTDGIILKVKEQLANINDLNYTIKLVAEMVCAKEYYIIEKYESLIKDLNLEKLDGRSFGQRGENISGGEKNKIAMARFLLPENNYGFFIIDEPFTNLDAISENECYQVMKRYLNNCNGILISHKLNLIKDFCDDIIVLDEGRIVEEGNHEKLNADEGLYRKLYAEFIRNDKSDINED